MLLNIHLKIITDKLEIRKQEKQRKLGKTYNISLLCLWYYRRVENQQLIKIARISYLLQNVHVLNYKSKPPHSRKKLQYKFGIDMVCYGCLPQQTLTLWHGCMCILTLTKWSTCWSLYDFTKHLKSNDLTKVMTEKLKKNA